MVRSALLLGAATLSLVSVLGAGPAFAQSKFDVVIGGDAYFEAGYVDQDRDASLRSSAWRWRKSLSCSSTFGWASSTASRCLPGCARSTPTYRCS